MSKELEKETVVKLIGENVKFKVEYPKDYKRVKHLADGKTIEVHKLVGKRLEKKGIGKVL